MQRGIWRGRDGGKDDGKGSRERSGGETEVERGKGSEAEREVGWEEEREEVK